MLDDAEKYNKQLCFNCICDIWNHPSFDKILFCAFEEASKDQNIIENCSFGADMITDAIKLLEATEWMMKMHDKNTYIYELFIRILVHAFIDTHT